MTATTNTPMIGEIVHYVLPNGRCRPALVIEHAAALIAADGSVQAVAELVAAQKSLTSAQDAADVAARSVKKGGGVATIDPLEQAQAAVDTLTRQRDALAEIDAQRATLAGTQADLEAAHAAERAAVGLLDLQVFTNGDSDGTQFGERVVALQTQQSVPLAVQRLAVPHDATARDGHHAPGTWHTLAEED
jgi:hypothetical protein